MRTAVVDVDELDARLAALMQQVAPALPAESFLRLMKRYEALLEWLAAQPTTA